MTHHATQGRVLGGVALVFWRRTREPDDHGGEAKSESKGHCLPFLKRGQAPRRRCDAVGEWLAERRMACVSLRCLLVASLW